MNTSAGNGVMDAFANSELPAGTVYQVKAPFQKADFLQSDPEFTRHDWSIYLSNLSQRAGVPLGYIRQLVLKELVDNALDEVDRAGLPGQVTLTQDGEHTYTVTDQGRGFPDTPEGLSYRFSIAKAMVSSKQWRKPTRGCVGNGLRVIVASVASGGGKILVKTRNQAVTLRPRLDGTTAIEDVTAIDWPVGSAITIEIDPGYHAHKETLSWAQLAIKLAQSSGEAFNRKPHPLWFDADHLALNMLAALGADRTLAWFVSQLDRCSFREVGQLVTENFGKGRLCRDVNKDRAAELLRLLQQTAAARIHPKQLGPMGREAWKHERLTDGYACEEGTFESGRHEPLAQIPFLVEAWAATCDAPEDGGEDGDVQADIIGFTINRSPAIVQSGAFREGRSRNLALILGDIRCELSVPKGAFDFAVNITSPFLPIVGDNKTPALKDFGEAIVAAVESAIRRSARNNPPVLLSQRDDEASEDEDASKSPKKESQRKQVLEILEAGDAIAKASGNGTLSFNQRSLYYVVRELVPGLEDGYFGGLVTEYENDHGDIPRMFRSNRGAFYEPHSGAVVPLGTLTVRAYIRRPWIYGAVLVCEKEDNVHMLREAGFAERWDCFLLSSSGFTTRALKDLIDHIGRTARNEPVRIFGMIDADAHGSVIFQTLIQETKARGARNIEITNLGLFPWEGLAEGLQHETGLLEIARKKSRTGHVRRSKVADYNLGAYEGEIDFDPDAGDVWGIYQNENRQLIAATDRLRESELHRLNSAPTHVQKIATIFEFCRAARHNPPEVCIREDTLRLAIDHVGSCLEAAAFLDLIANRATVSADAEVLLAKIRIDFADQPHPETIMLSRSEITAKYASHTGRRGALSAEDLYLHIIPTLIGQGLAKLAKKEGKLEIYAFRRE